jgi:suppressor for copper-sensitivity B
LATLVALLATIAALLIAGSQPTAAGLEPAAVATSSLIDWQTFDRAEAESLAAAGRLVFVDVTADWCFTCKVNERLALETDATAAAFDRLAVVAMKADWTSRDDGIASFLADHGRYGVPFYLLYRGQREPYVFSELLTQNSLLTTLDEAADGR